MTEPSNPIAPAARRFQPLRLLAIEGGLLLLIKLLQDHANRRLHLLELELELQEDSLPQSLTNLYEAIEIPGGELIAPEDRVSLLSLLRGTLVLRGAVGERLAQRNLELEQVRAYLSDLSKAADLITVMFGEGDDNGARAG
jgi:hypothetical protein